MAEKKRGEKKTQESKGRKKECVFCKIVADPNTKTIYESKNFVAFPDINPLVKGHTLVVPKNHFVTLVDLPESLGSELLDVIKKVFDLSTREGAEGFNVVMNNFPVAGQFVMHAHLHVLPRRKGDGLKVIG